MGRITVVLDNLRSTHNVGAIVRSGVGFGIVDYIAVGTTPYPSLVNDPRLPHLAAKADRQIAKTGLGSEEYAKFRYFADTAACIEFLNAECMAVIALEQTKNSHPLEKFRAEGSCALILGNEIDGVSETFLNRAGETLEIALPGPKKSLNVAVAAGIAFYELTK